MNAKTLVQSLIAAATMLLAGATQAQTASVAKLPLVVVSGKSLPTFAREASLRVVQLPRVVVEGRSLAAQQRDTQLAAAKSPVRGS